MMDGTLTGMKSQKDVEVYALALKDTNEIQGLVGVKKDDASQGYISTGVYCSLE